MADDMDMPDFEGLGAEVQDQHRGTAAAAARVQGSADEALDEEDELELALEAELEASAEQEQQQQQQAAAGGAEQPPAGQQQLSDAVPLPALQDAARAATAATAALQEEEDGPLPMTEDGFIDLNRLTAKQHQRYNTLVNEMLTEQQLDRYSAFRRSSLKKGIQLLMSKTLGGAPNPKAIIALSSVTKSFVDDLVAAAVAVAAERGETTPLQPAHIHTAYQRLIEQEKVPGKAPRRRTFL